MEVRKIRTVSDVNLNKGPVTVGRSSQNAIVLRDTLVSRRHCVIELIDGQPHVRDVGSTKGTYINDRRVKDKPTRLAHGDRITIRPFEIVIDHSEAAQSDGVSTSPHSAYVGELLEQRLRELEQREAMLLKQAKELQHQLAASRGELQESRDAARTVELALAEKTQSVHTLADETKSLRDQIAEIESRHSRDMAVAEQVREALRAEMDRVRQDHAALQHRYAELDSTRQVSDMLAQRSQTTISDLDRQLQVLEESAQQLDVVQERLNDAERAWAEIDREAELDAGANPAQIEAAAVLRRHLSSELISLNQQRDEIVMRLKTLLVALRVVVNRHGPQEERRMQLDAEPAPALPRAKPRKWFGLVAARE